MTSPPPTAGAGGSASRLINRKWRQNRPEAPGSLGAQSGRSRINSFALPLETQHDIQELAGRKVRHSVCRHHSHAPAMPPICAAPDSAAAFRALSAPPRFAWLKPKPGVRGH